MGRIIGIDLGTTNSVVAIMEGSEPKVITNEEGARTTPSAFAVDEAGEMLVGVTARRQSVTNPEGTVYSIKRFMGRKFDEVQEEIGMVPYKVSRAANGDAQVEIRDKVFSPPEISAKILQKLKRAAEAYLGEPVSEAVLTVPAYFNDSQRQATKDAGRIAGLEVKRIVNEPTAAALAYGLDKSEDQIIAVYDFGGGTFDISILEVGDKVVEVISTNGDTHLGGDNIDQRLIEHLIAEFKKDTGIDVSSDSMVLQRLKEAAEKAKIELSSTAETTINLPFLTADASGPKHMNLRMTRAKLEQLCDDIFERSLKPCQQALKDGKKQPGDIDEVILVGGSTRIPKVQELVERFFGKPPHRGVNPDEVVARGAAVQAGVLSGEVKDILLLDVTPLSLGIETLGGVMTVLIKRNTTIPTRKSEVFSTASDGQTSVEVHVLQGERQLKKDNRTLGRFSLDGIPAAGRGIPQIEVTFDIDANGIVHVSAVDKATSKEQKITISTNSGLSDDEIDDLVRQAESSADDDKLKRDAIEAHNKADSLVYQTEKTLKEHGDKISDEDRGKIEAALAELKQTLEGDDTAAIEASCEALAEASYKLAEAMYQQAASNGDGKTNGANAPGADGAADAADAAAGATEPEVVDAEFEEDSP